MWYRMTLSYSRHSKGWTEDRRPDSNVAKEVAANFIEDYGRYLKNDYSLFN
jgi:hypothetical protein